MSDQEDEEEFRTDKGVRISRQELRDLRADKATFWGQNHHAISANGARTSRSHRSKRSHSYSHARAYAQSLTSDQIKQLKNQLEAHVQLLIQTFMLLGVKNGHNVQLSVTNVRMQHSIRAMLQELGSLVLFTEGNTI